ncbi:N-acyl-D-amino-acid deacylase [Neobacillus notoginsengisoli]|uniref:N-acyl-D-amino-acid deacylase n=1 Tax=Neobacillus notoginsengisoli TaxID=1578198 RepID=A0A417YLC7_9BACI|nr:amidohydrolase family protein [Neobacillus notoginsengisoli]RHW33936.1 N-acyl-D-amino-acid deacylase [Neobacillus notoginsengisoli]
MSNLIIRRAHIKDGEALKDIKISGGKITEIATDIQNDNNSKEIDAKGNVVLPSLIESHIHPDKAFLEDRKPNKSGTLEEALKNTAELKKLYTFEDVKKRAEKVLRWSILNGTTIMRAQPDVDPYEKTLGVEVLVHLKEKFKDVLDMQIVAFPQEGIIQSPGVLEMMEETIKMGADIVGGCPYSEKTMEDTKKQLEVVFDLAEKYNLPIDMHADFGTNADDPQNTCIELICDMTIARGYQGRVAIGHVTTLGSLDPEVAAPIFDKIAKAGVTIVPLPVTDMFMTGRTERKNIPRGMAPVMAMMEHGVNIAYSSNNIRNAFTPFGNADLIAVGYLLQVSQQMGSADQRRAVLDMVTYNAAKALGISDTYGLEVGKNADLNIYDCDDISNLINDQPLIRYVIKRGEIIVQNDLTRTMASVLMED